MGGHLFIGLGVVLEDLRWPPAPLRTREVHPTGGSGEGTPPCPSAPRTPSCLEGCLHPMQKLDGDGPAGIKEDFPARDGREKEVGDGGAGGPP